MSDKFRAEKYHSWYDMKFNIPKHLECSLLILILLKQRYEISFYLSKCYFFFQIKAEV